MNKTLFFVNLFSNDAFLRFLFFNRINIFFRKSYNCKNIYDKKKKQ